jgi:hypothetical protein
LTNRRLGRFRHRPAGKTDVSSAPVWRTRGSARDARREGR